MLSAVQNVSPFPNFIAQMGYSLTDLVCCSVCESIPQFDSMDGGAHGLTSSIVQAVSPFPNLIVRMGCSLTDTVCCPGHESISQFDSDDRVLTDQCCLLSR
jgi:hypothetical protein